MDLGRFELLTPWLQIVTRGFATHGGRLLPSVIYAPLLPVGLRILGRTRATGGHSTGAPVRVVSDEITGCPRSGCL